MSPSFWITCGSLPLTITAAKEGLNNRGFFHWAPEELDKKPHFLDKTWRVTSVWRHATLKPPIQTSWLKHGNISDCTYIIELSSAVAGCGTVNISVMTMGSSALGPLRAKGLFGRAKNCWRCIGWRNAFLPFLGTICWVGFFSVLWHHLPRNYKHMCFF